ncbi:MAG: 6-phosphofructokinase [Candidatus Sumerlaeia bacterium]|nr:6-phosphofructokinase [Candidatus Sumerlaeia bacterium]
MNRIGVLSGGGDCPGINAVIRGIVLRAAKYGAGVVGFRRGWQGLLDGGRTTLLGLDDVEEIHSLGGTIIGTSRTDPFAPPDGADQVMKNFARHECAGLVVIGGEKTLAHAYRFHRLGLPVVGVPKTIDNNVGSTDCTFGFLTAANTATEAIDRLVTTAKSQGRALVVQVMGHNSGWLALFAGIAGGAHQVLIPEVPFDVAQVCDRVKKRFTNGNDFAVVVVAEGARPADPKSLDITEPPSPDGREDGVAKALAEAITRQTGIKAHHVALGTLQRGGSPSAFDRVLGMRMGLKAAELVQEGKFGMMVALRCTDIVAVPLEDAVRQSKTVPDALWREVVQLI